MAEELVGSQQVWGEDACPCHLGSLKGHLSMQASDSPGRGVVWEEGTQLVPFPILSEAVIYQTCSENILHIENDGDEPLCLQ